MAQLGDGTATNFGVATFYNNLNNSIHCTTQSVGGTAYTNCYGANNAKQP